MHRRPARRGRSSNVDVRGQPAGIVGLLDGGDELAECVRSGTVHLFRVGPVAGELRAKHEPIAIRVGQREADVSLPMAWSRSTGSEPSSPADEESAVASSV